MADELANQLMTIKRALDGIRDRKGIADDSFDHVLIALNRIIADRTLPQPKWRDGDSTDIAAAVDHWIRYEAEIAATGKGRSARAGAQPQEDIRAALSDFFRDTFPDEPSLTISDVETVSVGYSKRTFVLSLTSARSLPAELVVRADQPWHLFGTSVADEYPLLQALARHDVLSPRPLAFEPTGKVIGGPFMVFERLAGAPDGWCYFPPQCRERTAPQVARTLARIHAVPAAEIRPVLGELPGGIAGEIARQEAEWRKLGVRIPLVDRAFQWARDHCAVAVGPAGVVHKDFNYQNFLLKNEELMGVLDWEFAHFGNPAEDLGWHAAMAYPDGGFDSFMAAYAQAGGRVPSDEELDFFILWAHLRFAVLCAQADAGYRRGDTTEVRTALSWAIWFPKTLISMGRVLLRAGA